jgi:hypothetical protein
MFAFMGTRIRFLMPHGHSLNEYVLHRFGNAMYLLTLGIIVFYMFVYLTAELTAIAKAVELMAGVPLWLTAVLVISAVFIYTTVGGLAATIFTDAIQFIVIVPLLLLSFAIALMALGGWGTAIEPVTQSAPQLLSLANGPGIKFGATLVIAVISAEMFNQANWQRIYACRDDVVVRRSFLGSFLVIVPMLFIAGLLGILAMHFGFNTDVAFFSLIEALGLPGWVSIAVLVLVLALVMSSLDTLLNGIASVFTIDLVRFFPAMPVDGDFAGVPHSHRRGGHSRGAHCRPGLQRTVSLSAGGSGLCRGAVSGAVWPVLAAAHGDYGLLEFPTGHRRGGAVLPAAQLQPVECAALCRGSAGQLCRAHRCVVPDFHDLDSGQSAAGPNRRLRFPAAGHRDSGLRRPGIGDG